MIPQLSELWRLRRRIVRVLGEIQIDFGGGCSVSKAFVMAALIQRYNLTTSVDIGVYRGRSLFPQAIAQQTIGGIAYGVDPWSAAEAREFDNLQLRDRINTFVETINLPAIYENVASRIEHMNLGRHCILLRQTSLEAARYFSDEEIRFGLIHIDGNHDIAPVLADVEAYLPLMHPHGVVVMDDVSWVTVKPAIARIEQTLVKTFERVDQWNDYAVFVHPDYATRYLNLIKFLGRFP